MAKDYTTMKVLGTYTEVYRLDEDGTSTLCCFFLNELSLDRQLAHLLLELQGKSCLPYRRMDGTVGAPVADAMKEVVWMRIDPMPAARFEYDGAVYFGYVREYVEIEKRIYSTDNNNTSK